ncbi:MAG: hypothetical protein A2Y41_00875 [Spirochaetes bacterium GWB1_36_13]|nr:MAG: hypothetical protein A2Y41_00875 [Spirochaetes bacterium GWB1_36_13]
MNNINLQALKEVIEATKKKIYFDTEFSVLKRANEYKNAFSKPVIRRTEDNYLIFESKVQGQQLYDVSLALILEKDIVKGYKPSCSCPYPGLCKHIAAFIDYLSRIEINLSGNKNKKAGKLSNSVLYHIIHENEDELLQEKIKKPVSLEIYLDLDRNSFKNNIIHGHYFSNFYINFKLSFKEFNDKSYVVSKLRQLASALFHHDFVYEIGKSIRFSLDDHEFSEEESETVDFIKNILGDPDQISYSSYIYDKNIKVNNYLFEKLYFLNQKNPKLFYAKNIPVVFEEAEILYQIQKSQNKKEILLLTGFKTPEKYFFFDKIDFFIQLGIRDDFWIFISDSPVIYHVKNALFYQTLYKTNRKNELNASFSYEELPVFFYEIYPKLSKDAQIDLASDFIPPLFEDFQDQIIIKLDWLKEEKKLVIELYTDKKFINQFDQNPDIETPRHQFYLLEKNKYLVVNTASLNQIYEKISEYGVFKDNAGLPCFEIEEKVFEFLFNYLPVLKDSFEVEESESVKSLNLIEPEDIQVNFNDESVEGKINFLEINFEFNGIKLKYKDFLKILKSKQEFKIMENGQVLNLSRIRKTYQPLLEDIEHFKENKIPLNQYYFLYRQFLNQNIQIKESEPLQKIKKMMDGSAPLPTLSLNNEIENVLRDYQHKGVQWLYFLKEMGFGGILADDMGLGKTLQALTLIAGCKKDLPSLIVCPTSLVYNWEKESFKFFPDTKVGIIYGTKNERNFVLEDYLEYDILVTTYGILKRDIEKYQNKTFEFVFLDEAQQIKNFKTQNAESVKQITSRYRFVLSGTPIENSLSELWSLFDFIMPGFFPDQSRFKAVYETPLKNKDTHVLEKLKSKVKPFILRRMKKEVLQDIPDKVEENIYFELNETEKKLYLSFLETSKNTLLSVVQEKGFERSRIEILALLTRLRQICCHPNLVDQKQKYTSSKMETLFEIVDEAIAGGHKILIFSQFVTMLQIIEQEINHRRIDYSMIHGGTKDRMKEVDDFQNLTEKKIFLLSLKAGGTGLNLTAADIVIHYDPWWNPAAENQATDRAYRIGQENKVNVYRLISKGTIEEKIIALQNQKKDLIEKVLASGESPIQKLSWDDFKNLLEID